VPNFGRKGSGPQLKEGMVIAIEPITSVDQTDIAVLSDGWTIIARNGSPCAHFEDTVLVTEDGPVVLTA
jgi:methionyl aminopeptidase